MEANLKKALVIRLSSLGDVVLSTAALAPLRAAGYQISFLTKSSFASLLVGHPDIHEVFAFDKRAGEGGEMVRLQEWFAKREFDLVIDLQNSWRTWRWGTWMSARARVFRISKERLREVAILVLRLGRFLSYGPGGRAKKFRRFVEESIDIPGTNAPLTRLHFSPEKGPELPSDAFVALVPVSAWEGKQWPYFEDLAGQLAKKYSVVVLGGEKDFLCDQVAAAAGGKGISLRGKTNLAQSAFVLERAHWVIGNDTGMLHVAEALGKKVAMVEGPTHEYMGFSPYQKGSLLLGLPLLCRPCSKSGKICYRGGTRKCLKDLSVQSVMEKLRIWGLPC